MSIRNMFGLLLITLVIFVLPICAGADTCISHSASALSYGATVTARQISWLCEASFEACPINVTAPNGWEANWNGKDGCGWIGGGGPFGSPCTNMIVTGWNAPLSFGQFLGGFEVDFGSREPNYNEIAGMWWASFSGPSGSAEFTGYVIPVPEPSSALCLGTAISLLGGLLVITRSHFCENLAGFR